MSFRNCAMYFHLQQYFVIDQIDKYSMVIKIIPNMDEVLDIAYTSSELEDMYGAFSIVEDSDLELNQYRCVLVGEVKDQLKKWENTFRQSGKTSIDCTDSDLLEILKKHRLSDFGDFSIIRRKDSFINRPVSKSDLQPVKSDFHKLVEAATYALCDKFPGVTINVNYKYNEKGERAAFNFFKESLSWDEVSNFLSQSINGRVIRLLLPRITFFKQIWDNPDLVLK